MKKGGICMFYKKNNTPELNKELFKNPTSEYRGTPFWAWNCELTDELLTEQIEYLKEMGFGGFHMHARSGLATEYLSDDFMHLIETCVDKAEKEEMLAYLYDEDRWPSGSAGGFVTKNPAYREKYLLFTLNKQNNLVTREEGSKNGKTYLLAAYDIVLNDNGEITEYKVIGENEDAKGVKWYAYIFTPEESGWFNNQTYVDTLSKEAMDEFIKITYERYKEKVGDKFGGVIPSMFTDEPQFTRKMTLDYAHKKQDACIPWTTDFPETYEEMYGIDIVKALPELFFELPCGAISKARYCFHDHVCERFSQAFADNCGNWCNQNNIALTGHMMQEPSLESQTGSLGEAMRSYRSFRIPGIDMLCNSVELSTAKQAQSAVHQYGYEAMLSELYGVTGWDFDFRGHKFQGDWQAALGVTVRVPHLSWVSMKGSAKRDYPASISYQSPWFRDYKYVEDHFARVNTALTRGKPIVNVGVIHPIESYWLHWGPSQNTADIRTQMEDNFNNIINWLLFGMVDFDFISESLLPDQCGNISDKLSVGEMNYSAIVVPGCETIRRTTFEILKKYNAQGGKIIFVGDCPRYIDAEETDEVKALYDNCVNVTFNKIALLNALAGEKEIEVRNADGTSAKSLIYNYRQDGDAKWLFIAHGKKLSEIHPAGTDIFDAVAPSDDIIIRIKGEYKPLVYDTLSGEIKEIDYEIRNGYTEIKKVLYAWDSILLHLEATTEKQLVTEITEKENICEIDFKTAVSYKREEPNVLLLDMAEYKLDDGEFCEKEEILRIDSAIREILKYPAANGKDTQPWTIAKEKNTHFVTLKFTVNSEYNTDDLLFAAEEVEKIVLNGINVPLHEVGYYVDRSIRTYTLPAMKKGENILEITAPIGKRISLENCFVLGEFDVEVNGCEAKIKPASDKINFGSVISQGMPFYGGNITYETEIETPDCSLEIRVNHYKGAVVKVFVDGVEKGYIAYSPYILVVDGVGKGKHKVELKLLGYRENTFGALHKHFVWWQGPAMWYSKDDNWSYEYNLTNMGIISSPVIKIMK